MPNNQQATEIGNTSRDEAIFVVGVHWIVTRNTVSIIEDSFRFMKGHAVLHEVDDRLIGIPFVFHLVNSTVELNGLPPDSACTAFCGFSRASDAANQVTDAKLLIDFGRRTTAVTGPPPKDFEFKISVTGGSASNGTPGTGVNLWGAVPFGNQSPVRKWELIGGQYTKCNQTI
jgi:hypothetical protein